MAFTNPDQAPPVTMDLENNFKDLELASSRLSAEAVHVSQPGRAPYIPPHMRNASEAEKQEWLKQHITPQLLAGSAQSAQQPQGGRKRLNQAQRRQLNAQVTIPIDPRPVVEKPQHGRGFSFSSGSSSYGQQHGQYNQSGPRPYQQFPNFQSPSSMSQYSLQLQNSSQRQQPVTHPTQLQSQYGPPRHAFPARSGPCSVAGYQQPPIGNFGPVVSNSYGGRPPPRNNQLYRPQSNVHSGYDHVTASGLTIEQSAAQSEFLEVLAMEYVPKVGISGQEVMNNEEFRAIVERICRDTIQHHEHISLGNVSFNPESVEVRCFGSMASGFATKGSDMDLALLTPDSRPSPDSSESPIPRLLEKELLNKGYGARLLTRTRVPIIKLCQSPTDKLRSDLLEERDKWEKDFNDGTKEDFEEATVEEQSDHHLSMNPPRQLETESMIAQQATAYEDRLALFQQKQKQSLGDYYGSAKRLLQDLAGRDIVSQPPAILTPHETNILTDVCKAYVNGLLDERLKIRLKGYPSLSFPMDAQAVNVRSLLSVFWQIEGEQLAIAWENRPVDEATENAEELCGRLVKEWRNLMNTFDMRTITYNNLVRGALLQLKRIPSIQLVFLTQGQDEDAVQYHTRASKLMRDLERKDSGQSTSNAHIHAVLVAHYISGIRRPAIQDALQKTASQNELISMETLGIQHRILQLAEDYETALTKDMYDDSDSPDIVKYISFLRSEALVCVAQSTPSSTARIIQASDESTIRLLDKMRSLPDPGIVARRARDRYKDHLEFPKTDIGIQCDINFAAHLGLHNTQLLRCYALTDPRVKPLVLFIKYWAKVRGINTPYRGTLSSYGYVLMVLHYLTNIVQPFVCPNLQLLRRDPPSYLPPSDIANLTTCNGYDVRFWRDEKEIASLAASGQLNGNTDSLGKLLRGFFEYYACHGQLSIGRRGFEWMRDVLSLRTQGGLLSKQSKGWVGAVSVMETTTTVGPGAPTKNAGPTTDQAIATTPAPEPSQPQPKRMIMKEETKEIRHRYLVAIEDPFEIDHNVGRTVNHDGITAIREEFRRAWRIIKSEGNSSEGGLLDVRVTEGSSKSGFEELMDLLYGKIEAEKETVV